ncbi:ABC transporter ATP-binding protein [Phytohabitans suffuscus]|uniref:ATP-binding protein n=1 Tax=Phytohabitans suffuscus TaxID=624315 RepID=A0A6F8YEJ6_9ACTN|nr:ABC transporter ATP-binding protein [Phytohabitans suffuscus]BCB84526.1 ATP-binding protein [Phytohabitans suffuscus]
MLKVDRLSKVWDTNRRSGQEPAPNAQALRDVSFEVRAGELVSIIGPSGCGKSTLLEIVAGLQNASSGSVFVDGQAVTGPHRDVGMVFQEDATLPWLTAQRNVEFGLEFSGVRDRRERADRARRTLDQVGLAGFEQHYPSQLSGGMRQRVNIARVLAAIPKVVLLDEPFGALDEQTRLVVGDELISIWERSKATILLVTHSLNEAAMLSDRIVVMSGTPGTVKAIIDNPLTRPRSSDQIGSPEFSQVTGQMWSLLEVAGRGASR